VTKKSRKLCPIFATFDLRVLRAYVQRTRCANAVKKYFSYHEDAKNTKKI